MTAKLVVAGVWIGLSGAGLPLWAQGNSFAQQFDQKRRVNIMTPGSLYKNQSFNQNLPGNVNPQVQAGNRGSAAAPKAAPARQPLYKPEMLGVQPATPVSSFNTPPKTTPPPPPSPFASVFTPPKPAQQKPSQPPPLYNLNPSPQTAPPSPYAAAMPSTPLSTPAQQPAYSITPQFTTVSPMLPGGLPNTAVPQQPRTPFYSMGQQQLGAAPPALRPGISPVGVAGTLPPPVAGASPQPVSTPQPSAVPMPSSLPSTPLVAPLVTPRSTPLGTQLQQPFYLPQTPFAGPQPPK
jgi:hypothetical protein